MMPFDSYKCYLAMKNHFTKDNYDYIKYRGKSRATLNAFYKRKDRFWFEKFSRQKNDKEIEEFFIANFASCPDPESLWIGEMIKEGEGRYQDWQKKVQSLSYVFKEEVNSLFDNNKVDDVFDCSKGHPPILKSYLGGFTSLETLVICDRIFEYGKDFDKKLKDPVWETVSRRVKKYTPFLNINVPRYKKILKEVVINGSS
tara:strand:+ start:925 stop:1524 length:600 start_codon:yes stop_codon:yes gene_type:complete